MKAVCGCFNRTYLVLYLLVLRIETALVRGFEGRASLLLRRDVRKGARRRYRQHADVATNQLAP